MFTTPTKKRTDRAIRLTTRDIMRRISDGEHVDDIFRKLKCRYGVRRALRMVSTNILVAAGLSTFGKTFDEYVLMNMS